MKNIIGILVIIAAMAFVSCDPVEKRLDFNKGLSSVTDAEISNYIKIEQEIREGKKSNYFKFTSDGLKALTSFQYGTGKVVGTGTVDFIQCFIVTGEQEFIVTVKNADGSEIVKKYPFSVDECFNVAPEWALFCGTGSKTWTWNDDADPDCYGMGDVFADTPGWWVPAWGGDVDALEWKGATMTFFAVGSVLTKNRTDGSTVNGNFSFDMEKKYPLYDRSLGQLYTSGTTVLNGNAYGGDSHWKGGPVNVYEIVKLTEDDLELIIIDMPDGYEPDNQGWGQSTHWIFKALD